MTYIQRATLRNLVIAALLIAVGHSLQWYGFTTLAARTAAGGQSVLLSSYEWTLAQAVMVQMIYQVDILYFGALADAYLAWTVVPLIIVAGLYRYMSSRLAAIVAIAVLVGTVNLGLPITITQALWTNVANQQAPYPTKADSAETRLVVDEDKGSSELMASNIEAMSYDIFSSDVLDLVAIYNILRVALGPMIAFSILIVVVDTFRRRTAT
jgi:hypothetical protein